MAGLLNGYRSTKASTFTATFDELGRFNRARLAHRRGLPVVSVATETSTKVNDLTTVRNIIRTRW